MNGHTNCHDCPSLKVDDEKKLHDGRNIANPADDEDGDLELLNGDEDRPKRKGTPDLCQECWSRDGDNERLSRIVPGL